MSKHQHEAWQLQDSPRGGKHCTACGEHVGEPEPTTTDLSDQLVEAMQDTLRDPLGAGSDLEEARWDGEQWIYVEGGIDLPHLASEVLAVVAPLIAREKAEAWDKGYGNCWDFHQSNGLAGTETNPYRQEADRGV